MNRTTIEFKQNAVTIAPYIFLFPFAALLAIAPAVAFGRSVVTNATELMSYLGFGGKVGVAFTFEGQVVWGTSRFAKSFWDFQRENPDFERKRRKKR